MGKLTFGGVLVGLAFMVIYAIAGITNVSPGEVGIMVKMLGEGRGMQKEVLGAGTRWVEPMAYDVEVYDTRAQQYNFEPVTANTADGQPVRVSLSLEVRLDGGKVPQLHERIGRDYFERVVYPATESLVRNNAALQQSDKIYMGEGRLVIQTSVQDGLNSKLTEYGIEVAVNLKPIVFLNDTFVTTLEDKAKAAQRVTIAQRDAERAEQEAIRTKNQAEGEKQKVIKEAEAMRERLKLEGEGERLQKEEQAKGILAIAKAEAEGAKLQVDAYGSGPTYASVKWAEHMGPNVKVLGYPLGAPGTTGLFNVDGILGKALQVQP